MRQPAAVGREGKVRQALLGYQFDVIVFLSVSNVYPALPHRVPLPVDTQGKSTLQISGGWFRCGPCCALFRPMLALHIFLLAQNNHLCLFNFLQL